MAFSGYLPKLGKAYANLCLSVVRRAPLSLMPDFPCSSQDARIVAVFATMNRREQALGCVRALAAQSRPLAMLVVADNGSKDGTPAALRALQGVPFPVLVHDMPENRGNAGGIQEAIEIALAQGASAVWLLDDDSWPRPEALEALLSAGISDTQVCHPVQIEPVTGHLTWPVPLRDAKNQWLLATRLEHLPPGDAWESRPSWTGALIPRRILERAGPVLGDLFIRGEDDEYSFRIAALGVKYMLVGKAVLDHPGAAQMEHLQFFGKHFFWEPNLPEWKLYYKIRNAVWLRIRNKSKWAGCATAIVSVLAVCRYDRWSWLRCRVVGRALTDAWHGKLGRVIAPWAP